MNIKETFVKHWKNILLIILVLFSLSKCTSSCSRKQEINRLNIQIEQLDSTLSVRDSIIHDNEFELFRLNESLNSEKKHNDNFTTIASGNQAELNNKINQLTNENKNLRRKIKELEQELLDVYD